MANMMKLINIKNHLLVIFKNMVMSPNIPCMEVLSRMKCLKDNLVDTVRSMTDKTNLLECLFGEALKIVIYILDEVPSRYISQTPFEL